MHRWFCRRSPKLLRKKLAEFTGGQFLIKTRIAEDDLKHFIHADDRDIRPQREERDGPVFRGGIESLEVPDLSLKLVVVRFAWLCERRLCFDELWRPMVPKWVFIPPVSMQCSASEQITFGQSMNLEYDSFYFPKEGRRLKLWIRSGDYGRFYRPDDPENLVRDGNEFHVRP